LLFQVVEKQRTKIRDTIAKEKLEKSRKYRLIEKEVAKRTAKYTEARLKATKARNEYLLCMDAANSSIHKYFMDDLSDLIDCMDFGFHQSLSRAMMMRSSALEQVPELTLIYLNQCFVSAFTVAGSSLLCEFVP
jgi:SLIT-ROBO Rho GTPase activating protein